MGKWSKLCFLQSAFPLHSGLPSQPPCSLMCMWPSSREQVEEEPSGFNQARFQVGTRGAGTKDGRAWTRVSLSGVGVSSSVQTTSCISIPLPLHQDCTGCAHGWDALACFGVPAALGPMVPAELLLARVLLCSMLAPGSPAVWG